jgi:muramoyltetrapeptide carboxypeptidase
MDIPAIQPPKIKTGDTIAVIAPAGPIESRDGLDRGILALEGMGFRVRFDERIFQSSGYLAGDDSARAEELMRSFEDPSIQAIIALRGGYGCSRLIPLLVEKRLRYYPKIFVGFSDLTTLHLYFNKRFGWVTIHGPMAVSPALAASPSDQASHLLSLWTDPEYRPMLSFPQMESLNPGAAEGVLTGGCLSVIAASIGTPYEIQTKGKILFLEDQGEPPYRLDRMITHLFLADKLHSLAGVLLGDFVDCGSTHGNYTAMDTLRDIFASLNIPVLANFPAGHVANNWALPFGVTVRMDASARTIEFLEPAVR